MRKYLKSFTDDEINDILYDYEEHFSIDLSSGKTEEEIAEELGDPKDIAEHYKKTKSTNFEDTANFYAEKVKDTSKQISSNISNNINNYFDLITKILITVILLLCIPLILSIIGIIIGILLFGILFMIAGFIGIIASTSISILTISPLSTLFIGIGFLSISTIALGLLMTILSLYVIKIFINVSKKLYGYIFNKVAYKDEKISINSKIIKVLIVSLAAFIISFSIGFFQLISLGFNLSDEVLPKLNEVLNSIDNKYGYYINNKLDINSEKTTSIEGIDEIDLSSTISNINIKFVDNSELKVLLTSNYNGLNTEVELLLNKADKIIKIEENFANNISLMGNLNLILYIPKAYTGNLTVKSISGNINCEESVRNLKTFIANTVNGEIQLISIHTDKVSLSSTSGNIKLTALICKNSDIRTISGDITIGNLQGLVIGNSVSGDLKVSLTSLNGDSKLSTTSGNIRIKVNPYEDLLINYSVSPRRINISDDLLSNATINNTDRSVQFKNGINGLDLSTTSGKISLKSTN